jgi:broad specificity phosphatase PhoE
VKARLTLICHGATAGNKTASFPADEPLEPKAVEQTLRLKDHIGRADRILVAPSQRTRQTAETLGLSTVVEPAFRECNYGRWAGATIDAISREEPQNLVAWMSELDSAPHGGEPLSSVLTRMATWLDRNVGHSGHTILITHASVIRASLLHVLQAPHAAFWKIDVEPLSLTELSSDGRRWTVRLPFVR